MPEAEKLTPVSATRLTLHRQDLTTSAVLAWSCIAEYPGLHQRRSRILHANELAYYEKLAAPRRKTSYMLGRYAGKQALAIFLHEPEYTAIEIAPGVFTQPIVKFPTPEPVGISISHGGDVACALVFPQIHPMGIDVERIDRKSLEAMQSQILPAEVTAGLPPDLPELTRYTVIWTAKEALSKVLKCGMMSPFTILETVNQGQEASWYVGYFRHFGQYKFHAWVVQDHVITIVLPKWTTMTVNLTALVQPG